MIWVLVIVSPIAFFSRIFPAFQKGEYFFKSILSWDEWWKQFFEWTLIGVTAAFFLYLGEQLMVVVSAAGFMPGIPSEGGFWINLITAPIIEFMNVLLPWCVVLAFLFIGWMVAMDTKALGAKMVTDSFKKMGKAMAIAGVKATPGVIGGMAGRVGKGFQEGTGLSGNYNIEGKGLLGKARGKLGGAAGGMFAGGFTKKGREEGMTWAKKTIAPEGSIKAKMGKVMGGLKESLVGEVGSAAYDALQKEWGFKKKTCDEIDNEEECNASEDCEWINGKCWKKKKTRTRPTEPKTAEEKTEEEKTLKEYDAGRRAEEEAKKKPTPEKQTLKEYDAERRKEEKRKKKEEGWGIKTEKAEGFGIKTEREPEKEKKEKWAARAGKRLQKTFGRPTKKERKEKEKGWR